MLSDNSKKGMDAAFAPPKLQRDHDGALEQSSVADCIQWFLDHDPRVAAIKHPSVEELFQWKQAESKRQDEDIYIFDTAEDRLAIGIVQALITHAAERTLHAWISQLLNALEDASKTNEELSHAYHLQMTDGASMVSEAAKIPAQQERTLFLTSCWLEALCTAEIRVLGWIYQDLYDGPFHPQQID